MSPMKVTRILKKAGKFLLITILSLLLLLTVIIVVALNSENAITRLALKEVSSMIGAPVKVDNVSLRLFRNFPYATIEFNGFKMGGFRGIPLDPSYTSTNDTIVSLRKLFVSIKSRPLLKNKIEIESIEIEGFSINYVVDSLGVSNIDFLLASDSTQVEETPTDTTSILDVLLRKLTVRDISVAFRDDQMKASARIQIPDMNISARVLNNHIEGDVRGLVMLTDCYFDSTNIHLMQQAKLSIGVNYNDGKVKVDSLQLHSDGIDLFAKGLASMGDSIFMDMNFSLKELDIKDVIRYAPKEMLDEFGIIQVTGLASLNAKVHGYYYDSLAMPSVETNFSLKRANVKTTEYPELKHVSLTGSASVPNPNNLATASVSLNDFRIATDKTQLDVTLTASNLDKPEYSIKSNGIITLSEFANFIPDSTVEYLTGTIAYKLTTHGVMPDSVGMHNADYFLARTNLELKLRNFSTALDSVNEVKNLTVDFAYKPSKQITISNLALEAPGYNVSLTNTSMAASILGYVHDMDNMGLDIKSLRLQFGNNIVEGSAKVEGLVKPTFNVDTKIKLALEELRPFMPDSLVESLSGKVDLAIKSHGSVHLDSIDTYMMPIAFEQTSLKAKVHDLNFEMFDDTLVKVNKLSLDFAMANDTIWVDNMYANAHGIDFWVDSTSITNVYKAFLLEQKDKTIIVNTHMRVSDIDYAKFAPLIDGDTTQVAQAEPPKPTNGEEEKPMYIPPYIARGTLAAKSLKYDKNFLEDVSAFFRVDETLYVIDQLKFKAFGGTLNASATYDTRVDSLQKILFKADVKNMDINKLLADNDDFGQTDFTNKNISGKLSGTADGYVVMQDTTIHFDKMNMRGYFKLEDGGIYNFAPAMELAKVTNLRELDNIVFRTMESSVFIYQNDIFFPKTEIVSTALDMSVMGMQSFGDDFEYHLVVHLSDVLMGKSSKLLKEQGLEKDGFAGEDESNRKGLYLVAMDRKGEKRYGLDKKSLQSKMNSTIRIKERGLGLVFHPRLANYSTEIDRKEYVRKDKTDE